MSESGPVKRPLKTSEEINVFSDLYRVAPNAWRVTEDGKFWLLKTAKTKDTASKMLLRREWEISRNLQHPLIASSFAFLEDSPVGPAIKMEYVDGRILREFAASTPSLSLRKKIFSQILDAVEYLHHKGLLHNDIKPENVMVTFVGNDVKLIDFGLAESDSDYLNKRLGGTEGSSAPEVLAGDTSESSTASADIYSLGLILDLLFPGRYFFVKRKCLRKSAEARFADVASLRRAVAGADTRRKSFAALATVAALAGLAFVIREVTKTEIVPEEDTTYVEVSPETVERIRSDLSGFCRQAADSLADRTLVPDWEKASSVCNNINRKVADYRNSLKNGEQRYVCDTAYARLSSGLSIIASDIPMRDEAVVKKPDVPATPLSFTSGAAIDLGLPSGVMWASCNLCESGFVSSPEIFGDYYAWGETQPYYISQNPFNWKDGKAEEGYCSESYKWGHCGFHHLSKYCPSDKSDYWSGTGSPDDKIVLDPEDDAAHVKLGGKWRIPTCGEWRELREKCKWTSVSDINGTGVSGRLVTGPNGNSIFLPAAGYLRDTSLRDAGTAGNYWSSTLYSIAPNAAYCAVYGSTRIGKAEIRCFGLSVRPVF